MRFAWLAAALLMGIPLVAQGFSYVGQRLGQNDDPIPLAVPGSGLTPVIWPDDRTELNIVFAFEDQDFIDSAVEAMQTWNVAETRFRFRHDASRTGEACNQRDQINTVDWTVSLCGEQANSFGDALAVTVVTYRFNNTRQRYELIDADIILDASRNWLPQASGPPQTGNPDFRRVLIHELGHALGLEHPDEAGQSGIQAIMNSRVSAIEVPQQDDLEGLAFLYGGEAGGGGVPTRSGDGGGGGDLWLTALLAVAGAARITRRLRLAHERGD